MPDSPLDSAGRLALDAAQAAGCTKSELAVVAARQGDHSWRVVSALLGISRSAARALHARAVSRTLEAPTRSYRERDVVVPLDEEVRGWPAQGRGVGGAIRGTRPGDDASRAERDA